MTTTTETPMTELTRSAPFTHTVPGTAGGTYTGNRYTFVLLSLDEEPVGLLVDGEPHDFCKRCGMGYGHYMWSSIDENDICYSCSGEGFGSPTTEADIVRRAVNRRKAADRRAEKARREQEARDAAFAAWTAENADLVAALGAYLPPMVGLDDWDRDAYFASTGEEPTADTAVRKVPVTFLEKLAVQVADDRKPLSEKQVAAAEKAISEMQARHTERLAAGHWGTVGKRAEVEVTVTGVRFFDNDFGGSYFVSMKTAEGHVLKTWTSGCFVADAQDAKRDGTTIRVKATVKEHGTYRGLPETTVSRVTAL